MSPYGIVKLREAKGADSFNAAYRPRHGDRRQERLAEGRAGRGRCRCHAGGHEPDDDAVRHGRRRKSSASWKTSSSNSSARSRRSARRAWRGEVVAADFYLRQVTFLEVAFDMMSEGLGLDGWELLGDLRRGGHRITEIAETPMSRMLDDKRRELWRAMSGAGKARAPARSAIWTSTSDHSTEPLEFFRGGDEEEGKRASALCGAACGRCADPSRVGGARTPLPQAGGAGGGHVGRRKETINERRAKDPGAADRQRRASRVIRNHWRARRRGSHGSGIRWSRSRRRSETPTKRGAACSRCSPTTSMTTNRKTFPRRPNRPKSTPSTPKSEP